LPTVNELASQELAKRYSLAGRTQMMPMAPEPADRGYFGVTGMVNDYAGGLGNAARSTLSYLIDTEIPQMASDAARFGRGMVQGIVDDPMMAAVDFIPGAGLAMGGYEAEQLRAQALEAEQAGQFDLADSLRAQASSILAMSAIPGGRTAKRGARMDMAGKSPSIESAQRVNPGQSELRNILLPGDVGYDPRFSPRRQSQVNKVTGTNLTGPEKKRLDQAQFVYEGSPIDTPEMSIVDLEGRPFMTTMSDRTAAGYALTGIGDVQFDRPVVLRGGQDFMFDDPNLVWASDPGVVDQMYGFAQELQNRTGQSPVFLPWRMAPTGGDYATMTTDVMYEYAHKNMDPKKAKEIDDLIRKGKTITKRDKDNKPYKVQVAAPEWKGIKDPASAAQIAELSGDQRKLIQGIMDVEGRDAGGLSLGEARLSVSDPTQYQAAGGGLQNVGLVNALSGVTTSTHPTYRGGLYGEGMGRLKEDVQAYQLLPEAARYRMQPRFSEKTGLPIQVMTDPRNPTANDLRALQMKPYGGVITEQIIRNVLEGN
jgi:hypothetical protein